MRADLHYGQEHHTLYPRAGYRTARPIPPSRTSGLQHTAGTRVRIFDFALLARRVVSGIARPFGFLRWMWLTISKRGNRYLRTLFMQGARVILLRPANWARHSFGPWLTAAAKRLHHNVLATALANKLARIAWTVLAQRRNYETRIVTEAA